MIRPVHLFGSLAALAAALSPLSTHAQPIAPLPLPPPILVTAPAGPESPNVSELQLRKLPAATARMLEESEPGVAPPAISAPPFRASARAARWAAVASGDPHVRLALGAKTGTMATLGLGDAPTMTVKKATVDGAPACIAPDLIGAGDCCSYILKDMTAGKDEWYRRPKHAFGDPTSAAELAKSVRVSIPMFLPYREDVHLVQGWIYESGGFHGASDFQRTSYTAGVDPSFKVHAVADGKVLAVYWDNLMGNVVVIEHKGANGDRVRSVSVHLRDGFDHDLAAARAINIPADKRYGTDGKPTRPWKYKQYADKPNPSQLQWGTNAQKIAVKPGDTVHAGQFLAWTGNTGDGGAGNGLDDQGNPTDPVTANNHLHLMMAVPHPTTTGQWVQIDPYGVYAKKSSNCYDVMDEAAYARLYAPFYPSFHNVSADYVSKYFGYYTGLGLGLQTLALHRKDQKVLASGAFESQVPGDWYARFWMTGADYQQWFNEYDAQGYRPRQIQVALDNAGQARFSVIWQRRAGEAYVAFHDLDDAGWAAKWKEWIDQKGFRVEDRVGYTVGGARKHAAVFVKDGAPFYELHYMDGPTLQSKFNEFWAQGFRMTSLDVADGASPSYGGVWRKAPGYWVALAGLSPSGYQDKFVELASQGYRLHRVDAYANSSRFAAIWTK